MRRVGLMDLHYAARAVQIAQPQRREAAFVDLRWRAHVADKYVKRLRKLHPTWGDGSLRSVALADLGGTECVLISSDLLSCIAIVSRMLAHNSEANAER